MAKIKTSALKELFKEHGLSEGIFDIFNKRKKKLKAKIQGIESHLDDTIAAAPTEKQRKALEDLRAVLTKMQARGTY